MDDHTRPDLVASSGDAPVPLLACGRGDAGPHAGNLPAGLTGPRIEELGGPSAPLTIDRAEMLRYLGYTGQEMDDGLAAKIEQVARDAEAQARARCVLATFPVDATSLDDSQRPCIRLEKTVVTLTGRDIYRHLKDARWCTVFACTLGMENERRLRVLGSQHPLEATLFDAASSALIEAAVERIDSTVRREAAAAGLSCNWRFSCGYGDCPLESQRPLLSALDAGRRIGLTVTPTNLMVPSKSVTALVGIFDGPVGAADAPNRCAVCRMRSSCSLRSRGTTC